MKKRTPRGVFLFLATGFELTYISFHTAQDFLVIIGMWQKPMYWTRESLKWEGSLETKDLEFIEKFVIFKLLCIVCL